MEVSVETCWKSLNKIHEELCGDKVEILKTEDSDVVILADGMGSGVKANILATLTSKILRTMFQKGAPIEQGVETIARTLPICQVRQVAYSTFSILQIFHNGEAYLVEYDNPGCIFVRDGKLMDIPYTVREIEGKKIREYRFQVKLKDCFVLMSDGVIYAGVGELLNFGWTWESMAGKILERMDILQVAKPYMERLSDLSGEAVHLVQREGNHILYIYKIEAKVGTIRMVSHVGMVHPMYCSGVGKAIMATLPDEEVKKIWNESIIEKKTDKTITDFSQMQEVLEEVRQNGYALDDEENEKGVRCIAACLHGYQKEVKYAFSISGPTSRMTRERVKELAVDVKKVQEELSRELGYYKS